MDIEKIKDLIDSGQIIAAQEFKPTTASLHIADDFRKAIHTFDNEENDLSHYIVSFRKPSAKKFLNQNQALNQNFSSADNLSDLVNETLKMTSEVAAKEAKLPSEEFDKEELLTNAKVLENHGELTLARNIYRSMVKKGIAIAEGLCGIARTLDKEGALIEAEKYYKEALAYSSSADTYQNLVSIQIRLAKDEEASKHLLHALGLPNLTSDQKFDFNKSLGNCYARLGDLDRAAHHYGKSYDLKPQSDVLQVNVGSLALQKNDSKSAEEHFRKALELNPKNDKALHGLGMVALAKNELQRAHDFFVASLEIDIQNIGAIYNLVKSAYDIKKYDAAGRMLELYMKANPDSRTNTNILYSYCGILFHLGHYNTSAEEADRILKLNPQHSGAKEIKSLIATVNQGRSHG